MLNYLVFAIGAIGVTVGVSVSIWSFLYTRRQCPPTRRAGRE
jgi:hypothetical protein